MAGIEQDVSWWVKELAVITAAPVAAISYAVVVAVVIWAILHFVYRERIEALKEQVNLAKAGPKGPDKDAMARRQAAVDALSREVSFAIHDLLNRHSREKITDEFVKTWEVDYHAWCSKVNGKLSDRSFFTESDQLLFDRLGEVPNKVFTGHQHFDWLLTMLNLKFERLREIIKLVPQRPL